MFVALCSVHSRCHVFDKYKTIAFGLLIVHVLQAFLKTGFTVVRHTLFHFSISLFIYLNLSLSENNRQI